MLARQLHERQVSFVQVAHGGHERHAVLAAQVIPQVLDGVYDFQGGSPEGPGRGWGRPPYAAAATLA